MGVVPDQARVLVVSASPYMRYVISGELSSAPDLFVVGTARTPDEIGFKEALLRPDMVIVDLESTRDLLDLQPILIESGLPMLALCSHNHAGAVLAFAALEAGVADVVARPNGNLGIVNFMPALLRKLRGLARISCKCSLDRSPNKDWPWPNAVPRTKASPEPFSKEDSVVVVSASTGGLGPLIQLLTALPTDLSASFLVLSDLPESFLQFFLRRVSPSTAFHVRQARDNLSLKRGMAFFAVYDYHLMVASRGYLVLDRGPRCNGLRPSADVTMSSLAIQYGPAVIGVILSGIGSDGLHGARDVRATGGFVIVQDTATCFADETPASVIEAGAATLVLPPEQIADEIVRCAERL
jgi:two-component system chemotaxis response regulator CheB